MGRIKGILHIYIFEALNIGYWSTNNWTVEGNVEKVIGPSTTPLTILLQMYPEKSRTKPLH